MSTAEESAFDEYRNAVERPIYRLFAEYGLAHRHWFVIGMTANVLARTASLLPPLVLGSQSMLCFQRRVLTTLPISYLSFRIPGFQRPFPHSLHSRLC